MSLCIISNHDIAGNHAVFCHTCRATDMKMLFGNMLVKTEYAVEIGIFLMQADKGVIFTRFYERLTDNASVGQWNTVIRKTYCTSCQETLEICQMLSIKILCDCRDRLDMDIFTTSRVQHFLQSFNCRNGRIGIGHHYNGRKTTCCCCQGPRVNIFLMSLARLPEMHMYIHQTRSHNQTTGINDFCIFRLQILTDFNNLLPLNQEVSNLVKTSLRIHNSSVFD